MAKAAVEKIRNMTTDDMRGITLFFSKEWRGVQPLVLVWAHLLRLYLTCCLFRYGTSSARFSIGFPADILQETAVHQSRGRRRGAEKGGRRDEGKGGICCNNALSKCTKSSFLAIYFQIGDSSYICGFNTTHQRCIGYGTRGRTCSSVVGGGTRGSGSKKCLPRCTSGSLFDWLSNRGKVRVFSSKPILFKK